MNAMQDHGVCEIVKCNRSMMRLKIYVAGVANVYVSKFICVLCMRDENLDKETEKR